jgi:hypothetical protein
MLIYHITNNKLVCTQVMSGFSGSKVSHGTHVWEKHQSMIDELKNDGDILITGATFVGAVYSGSYHKRENFTRYIEKGIE